MQGGQAILFGCDWALSYVFLESVTINVPNNVDVEC